MGREFVIGDIHGGHKALLQCLERCNFNTEEDLLISLGDVVDGWSDSPECIETLLSLKNTVFVRGNHDKWCFDWILGKYGHPDNIPSTSWYFHGGKATYEKYLVYHIDKIDKHAKEFFAKQVNYHIDSKNRLFIHAGFDRFLSIKEQVDPNIYYWDREFWKQALNCYSEKLANVDNFEEIFIGHTSTTFLYGTDPIFSAGVWNLDTGGGWDGKLTIMDINTKEYWQSDNVRELYKNEKGRN